MLTTLSSKMKTLYSSVLTISDKLFISSKKVIVGFLRLRDLYLRRHEKLVLEIIGLQESTSSLLNLIFLTLRERLSFLINLSVPSAGLIAFVRLVFRTNYSAYLKWRQEYFVRAIKKVYEIVRKLSSNG
jgi:hypothetical protein